MVQSSSVAFKQSMLQFIVYLLIYPCANDQILALICLLTGSMYVPAFVFFFYLIHLHIKMNVGSQFEMVSIRIKVRMLQSVMSRKCVELIWHWKVRHFSHSDG